MDLPRVPAGFDTPVENATEGETFEVEWYKVPRAETLDGYLQFAEVLADQFVEGRSLSRSDETGFVLEELTFEPTLTGFVRFASRDEEPDYWTDSDRDWVDFGPPPYGGRAPLCVDHKNSLQNVRFVRILNLLCQAPTVSGVKVDKCSTTE